MASVIRIKLQWFAVIVALVALVSTALIPLAEDHSGQSSGSSIAPDVSSSGTNYTTTEINLITKHSVSSHLLYGGFESYNGTVIGTNTSYPTLLSGKSAAQFWPSKHRVMLLAPRVPNCSGCFGYTSGALLFTGLGDPTVSVSAQGVASPSPGGDGGFVEYLFLTPTGTGNWSYPYFATAGPNEGSMSVFRTCQGSVIFPYSYTPYIVVQWDPAYLHAPCGQHQIGGGFPYEYGVGPSTFNLYLVSPGSGGGVAVGNIGGPGPSGSGGWDGLVPSGNEWVDLVSTYSAQSNDLGVTLVDDNDSAASFSLSENLTSFGFAPDDSYTSTYYFGVGGGGSTSNSWGLLSAVLTGRTVEEETGNGPLTPTQSTAFGPSQADWATTAASAGASELGNTEPSASTSGPSPSPRWGASLTYDAKDGYVVLFGGAADLPPRYFSDTWTFVNGTWTNITPTISPQARAGASMVYDAKDGYVLLFGGSGAHGVLDDTWSFVGGKWTELSPTKSPSARSDSSMVYDSPAKCVLMFGGLSSSTLFGDTWKFSGGAWKQLSPKTAPSPRADSAITFDSQDGYVLLFGGFGPSGEMDDTWTYVAGSWQQQSPTISPPAGSFPTATYDAKDGYVVLLATPDTYLYNSSDALAPQTTTWTFHAGEWTNITSNPTTPPYDRSHASITYDSKDSVVLLFGGFDWPLYSNGLGDTWEFTAGDWTEPSLGPTYEVTFSESGLPSGTSWQATLQGVTRGSTSSTIAFSEPNGTFSWSILSPLPGSTGVRYSATQTSGSITLNGASANQSVTFDTQFNLTTTSSPSSGGSVSPPYGWYTSGTTASLTATANTGYKFVDWEGTGTGSYSGSDNPAAVTLNGPITETAVFKAVETFYSIVFTESGLPTETTWQVTLNGISNSSAGSTIGFSEPNDSYSWTLLTPLSGGSGVQYSGTPSSGTVDVSGANQGVAITFTTQYQLSTSASPSQGGTVSPATEWATSGTQVSVQATPNAGYSFSTWTGSGSSSYSGSKNPVSITMGSPVSEVATFVTVGPTYQTVFQDNFGSDTRINTTNWAVNSYTLGQIVKSENSGSGGFTNGQLGPPGSSPSFSSSGVNWNVAGALGTWFGITTTASFTPTVSFEVQSSFDGTPNGDGTPLFACVSNGTASAYLCAFASNSLWVGSGPGEPSSIGAISEGQSANLWLNLTQSEAYVNFSSSGTNLHWSGAFSNSWEGYSLTIGSFQGVFSGESSGNPSSDAATVQAVTVSTPETQTYTVDLTTLDQPNGGSPGPATEVSIQFLNAISETTIETTNTGSGDSATFSGLLTGVYDAVMTQSYAGYTVLGYSDLEVGNPESPSSSSVSATAILSVPAISPLSLQLSPPQNGSEGNVPFWVTLTATASGGTYDYSYAWTVNGQSSGTNSPQFATKITTSGSYTVQVSVSCEGTFFGQSCSNSPQSAQITVQASGGNVIYTMTTTSTSPSVGISYGGTANEMYVQFPQSGAASPTDQVTTNVTVNLLGSVPIPSWLQSILGISTPFYALSVSDSAGSTPVPGLLQANAGEQSVQVGLPSGTPTTASGLESSTLTLSANPTTTYAYSMDLIAAAFAIGGITFSGLSDGPAVEAAIAYSLANSLSTGLESLNSLPPSEWPSVLSHLEQPVLNTVISAASAVGWSEVGNVLGKSVGEAITLAQFAFDALTMLDAIVTGPLSTTYTFASY